MEEARLMQLRVDMAEIRKDLNQMRRDINALNKGCVERMNKVNVMMSNLIAVMTHETERNVFVADAMKRAQMLIMKAEDNEAEMRKDCIATKAQNRELLDRLLQMNDKNSLNVNVNNEQN